MQLPLIWFHPKFRVINSIMSNAIGIKTFLGIQIDFFVEKNPVNRIWGRWYITLIRPYLLCVIIIFLPDASATRVIVEHTDAMLPSNIAGGLWNFADDTFQFDCAACLIIFIRSR